MEIVPQLIQALVILVVCAVIVIVVPFLFMIVFGFAYGAPAPGAATRRHQPVLPNPDDDEAAERE